jgi:hypothetical protein
MDKVTIDIDQKQIAELLKKADPEKVKPMLAQLMKDAGHHGRGVAIHNISGGTQQAGISMRFDVTPTTAKVYSVMPPERAMSIEEGRKPGEEPPLLQIARWVTCRRYLSQRRLSSLSSEERATTLRVREKIRASGTAGKKFIAGAHEVLKKDLPGMLKEIARSLESMWRS